METGCICARVNFGYHQTYSFLAFIHQSTDFTKWMRRNKRIFNLTENISPKFKWTWKCSASFDHQSDIWTQKISMEFGNFHRERGERRERNKFQIGYDFHNNHTTQSNEVSKVHATHSTILRIISLFLKGYTVRMFLVLNCLQKKRPGSMISIICAVHMTTHSHTHTCDSIVSTPTE